MLEKKYKVCSELSGECYVGDNIQYNITEWNVGEVFLGREGSRDIQLVSYEEVYNYDELEELFSEDFVVSEIQ